VLVGAAESVRMSAIYTVAQSMWPLSV
jgi:hypothetical protein